MEKDEKKGMILAVLGSAGWGISGTCSQALFSYSPIPPLTLTVYRLLLSGLLLLIINSFRHKDRMFDIFKSLKDTLHLIFYGIAGMALIQLSYLSAVKYSNSGTATILQSSGIILLFIITSIMQRKKPSLSELLCLFLVITGVFLVVTHGKASHLNLSEKGLFWGLAAAVAVVLYTLLAGSLTKKYGTSLILGYAMVIGGIFLFLVSPDSRVLTDTRPLTLLAISFIVTVGTAFGFSLYLSGVSLCGARKASMLSSTEPVVATLTSALFLHTAFEVMDILGFAAVITGCVLLTKNSSD